jgi:hypothetical protein
VLAIRRIGFLAIPAIACGIPLTSANAVPVSDTLEFHSNFGLGTFDYPATESSSPETVLTSSALNPLVTSDPNGTGIYFTESNSSGISDYVFACNGAIAFASEEGGQFALPACAENPVNNNEVYTSFVDVGAETGAYVDITSDFPGLIGVCNPNLSFTCTNAEGTLSFVSSINGEVTGVPEPATWLVMLTGLLSLLGFRKSKRAVA